MKWNIGIGKKEFSRKLAENANITYKDSRYIVDIFLQTLTEYMLENVKVTFKGFGFFDVVKKSSRKGVNIDGEEIVVEGFNAVRFKQTAEMKQIMNEEVEAENE